MFLLQEVLFFMINFNKPVILKKQFIYILNLIRQDTKNLTGLERLYYNRD
jgi:hypothetical protein